MTIISLLAGALGVPLATPVAASAATPDVPGNGCGVATPAAVADFFNQNLPPKLAADHVPGAVMSVVSGGQTVFAHGYGLADVAHGVAFEPDRSLVRIASITKLFTWTAVMQQVAAGRLDLDTDVNHYLTAFKVPATYPQPVTLRTLMNHTAGFEYSVIGTGARAAADVPPLGEYLATHMPERIRPPGEVSAYSNYGAALAGYIVSKVTGEPYDSYVENHIMRPLGMIHSTATEPVPTGLAANLAHSYDSDTGQVIPFIFDPMTPDGSISATASDLAHFMIAHLDGGGAILDPATVSTMDEPTFAAAPGLDGWAHGFEDKTMNGHRVLMHDGSWEGFESLLILVPDCDLGWFVSANATGGIDALVSLIPQFFDRFAPTPTDPAATPAVDHPAIAPTAPLLTPAAARPGFYENARHSESTVEKILTLVGPARLTVDADTTVHFAGKLWRPDGGGRFTASDGSDHLAFLTGADGQHYIATDGPTYQLEPASQTLPVNGSILVFVIVVALSGVVLPVVGLARRLRHEPARGAERQRGPAACRRSLADRAPRASARWRLARGLSVGASGLGLVFLVGLAAILFGDTSDYIYGVPLNLRLLLILPILVMLLFAAGLGYTVVGWRGGGASLVSRVHQVVVLTSLVALVWFCAQWNLIGWQF
jgi:CubicO group peptidase (beta-lactamase class C family)